MTDSTNEPTDAHSDAVERALWNADPSVPDEDKFALDVWLRFANPDDEESEYEANCYPMNDGRVAVRWYHVDVGLVSEQVFNDHAAAQKWLTDAGYQDFSS